MLIRNYTVNPFTLPATAWQAVLYPLAVVVMDCDLASAVYVCMYVCMYVLPK